MAILHKIIQSTLQDGRVGVRLAKRAHNRWRDRGKRISRKEKTPHPDRKRAAVLEGQKSNPPSWTEYGTMEKKKKKKLYRCMKPKGGNATLRKNKANSGKRRVYCGKYWFASDKSRIMGKEVPCGPGLGTEGGLGRAGGKKNRQSRATAVQMIF